MKILVAIANYGRGNDKYLSRVLDEYRSFQDDVHIVVCTNLEKDLGPDVEVVVGLPTRDPWSLPFAHKRVLAERLNDYDLFIYSEDDTLIQQHHISGFLDVTRVLPETEIAGFIRRETAPDGKQYYCDMHTHFHWDAETICRRGEDTFACFTNEHAACYLLTKDQLRKAIKSGGFLVEPRSGKYDLACTASTDPYTNCGFRKMVCISRLAEFTVQHLSNKYAGRFGVDETQLETQVEAMLAIARFGKPVYPLVRETNLPFSKWSKDYDEPRRDDVLEVIPSNVRTILFIGCGTGHTEEALVQRGCKVIGLPLDPVIAACAEARGVQIVHGDWRRGLGSLATQSFDCAVVAGVLHLMDAPEQLVSRVAPLLKAGARLIATLPNFDSLPVHYHRLRGDELGQGLCDYAASGLHLISQRTVRRWLQGLPLSVSRIVYQGMRNKVGRMLPPRLGGPLFASELLIIAEKNAAMTTVAGGQSAECLADAVKL